MRKKYDRKGNVNNKGTDSFIFFAHSFISSAFI